MSAAWIQRKVRKGCVEHGDYLRARFPKGGCAPSPFNWDGHNWRYLCTSFDDIGEFDILQRPNEDALVAPHNPPAFPVQWDYADNETGMSLRDHFAGQALPALIAQIYAIGGCADGIAKPVAEIAYEIADAMLAARGDA